MASSSKRVKMMPTPTYVTTFGPTGTPHDLQESGANILNTFCNSYPDTETHCLLPCFFGDNITELMEPRENLSRREVDQFRGRQINQVGEGHELVVFNIFVRLIRQKNVSPTLLIMRTFDMDMKNPINLKRNALHSLLPNINLESVNTQAENDYVVLVQNVGVVCIEAKGSTKDNMVRSAKKQLTNLNKIVQSIMKAVTKDEKRMVPTLRLIIVPDCTNKTPADPSPQGSYFVFKHMCENFEYKWENVIKELDHIKSKNPFTPAEYKELCQILVGLWSAKAISVMQPAAHSYELKQDETSFSYARQLEKIDKIVVNSNIRNERDFKLQEERLNPFTTIVRTEESDIFRSCNDLKLCYLTPAQKELFSFRKQVICRGSAGCGKSLLILFKVIELIHDLELSFKILLLAPKPQTIRINNALFKNNITADMIKKFPPPPSSHNVFVMELEKFFQVERTTLMSCNMSGYHLFVDDLQQLEFWSVTNSSFFDVGDFVDELYNKCVEYDRYLWIMLDVVQGYMYDGDGDDFGVGWCSHDLFLTSDKHPRTYNIPIVTLSHVMRNTHHIMEMTNEARKAYVTERNVRLFTLPSPQVGHKVTSHKPVCHKLKKGTDEIHVPLFIVTRLREVLQSVTKPPYSLPLSNVAVIYDSEYYLYPVKDDITSFLINEFGTTPQTIEEQLTNNNTTDIVMDETTQIVSFEVPVVVFIHFSSVSSKHSKHYYTIGTHACVSLTIIDVDVDNTSQTYNNMDVVLWKPDGSGNFTK